MSNSTKSKETPAQSPAPVTGSPLASVLAEATAQAAQVTPRTEAGDLLAGPFPVGNIGQVEVRAVKRGTVTYTNAVYMPNGGGKVQRIPLAAVAALHEELGA